MPYLPVDTAIFVEIGPLVDNVDWQTLETSVASNAAGMSVDLIKNSSTAITKIDITPAISGANAWGHKGNGVYELQITSAQNDTEGTLRIVGIADGVLPFESPVYTIVPIAVYNSLVAGTDKLAVDAQEISSSSAAADNVEANIANLDAAISSLNDPTAATIADAVWDEALAGHVAAGSYGKAVADIETDAAAILVDTAGGGAGPWTTASAGPTAADIADAVWDEALVAHLGSGSTGEALDAAGTGGAPSAAAIADAVWDEALAGHVAAGSYGKAVADIETDATAILADTTAGGAGPWTTAADGPTAAVIADAVWDEALAGHVAGGSYGKAVADIESDATAILVDTTAGGAGPWTTAAAGPTAAAVADAVWDEALAGHVSAGSAGKAVADIEADTDELQSDDVPGLIAAVQSDTDDIQTRLPDSLIGGRMSSDVEAVSGATTAADNLKSMYDGTGYNADTAPASRAQVGALGLTGGGTLNFEANADNSGGAIDPGSTAFVGVETNDYTDTALEDGTYHVIADSVNIIDVVYGFNVGGGRTAVEVIFRGFANANNDDLTVSVWDHVGAAWNVLGILAGKPSTSNVNLVEQLLSRHTGTSAAEIGKVYIRFNGSGLSANADLNTDQILVEAVSIGQSSGYAAGAIWVDTNGSNANTEPFVDGVADNPVSTWAAALTLSAALGITDFHIINGSTITLSANSDHYSLFGDNWTLDLNGQSIVGMAVFGANVSGVASGTGDKQHFEGCHMGATTHRKDTSLVACAIEGAQTAGEAGDYFFDRCHSGIAGTATPVFDFAAVGSTNLNMRSYSGGIRLEAMGNVGTDAASIEGHGQVVEGTCTAGVVAIRGNFTVSGISNLTLSDDARFDVAQVNAEVDTALADYDGPTHAELISEIDDVQTDIAALNDPTAAAIADAVWDEALAGHVAGGSFGKAVADIETDAAAILVDTAAGGAGPWTTAADGPTAAAIADAVWDESLAAHQASGSMGEALEAADATADVAAIADAVWDEALAGHVAGGSYGKAVADIETDAAAILVDTASGGAGPWTTAAAGPTAASIADAVWDEALAGHVAGGSAGKALGDLDTTSVKLASDGWDAVIIEAGINARQALSIIGAATGGELSGAQTSTVLIMGLGTLTPRITAEVDGAGNRDIVTLTPPV